MKQFPKGKVIAAASMLGLVTAMLVYLFLSREAAQAREYVPVVSARESIAAGTIVDDAAIEVRRVPRNTLPAAAAVTPEMVVGKVARKPIRVGEPVSLDSLAPKNRLSQMVPPLMRAVTVALDPIIGVGGFLKPGDHVDVVATFEVNDGTVTKTVLQNVELLATGSEATAEEFDPNTGKMTSAKSQPNATLAVMPADAERLILADSKGKLRLTLRRPDDVSHTQPVGTTGRAVMGAVPPDVPQQSPARQTPPASASTQSRPIASINRPPILPHSEPFMFQPPISPISQIPETRPLVMQESGKKVQVVRGTTIDEVVVQD